MTDVEFKKIYDFKIKEFCILKYDNLSENKEKYHTFNDKIKWLTIYNCTQTKIDCTDKIKCRNYCKNILGYDLFPKIIKVYNDPININLKELPQKTILKCNHGCGFNLIINKNKFNGNFKKTLQLWLLIDYSKLHGEYHYHFINRKCFSEEFLGDDIIDYKFYCFHGIPKYIECVGNRNSYDKFVNSYDIEFNPLYNIVKDKSNYKYLKKPKLFDEMIEISKQLSKEFKFVRVDFYYFKEEIYLSELTFSPAYGNIPFFNKDIDLKFGEYLKL